MKLTLFAIAFYEDVKVRSSFLMTDGDQTADSDLTDDIISKVKFFTDFKEAEKECIKQNKEIEECGLNEQAVVEEYILNVKTKRKKNSK